MPNHSLFEQQIIPNHCYRILVFFLGSCIFSFQQIYTSYLTSKHNMIFSVSGDPLDISSSTMDYASLYSYIIVELSKRANASWVVGR